MTLLEDTTQFSRFGPVDTQDHTTSIETKFQKNPVKWDKSGLLPSTISDLIKPISSICPHLYGLPEIH